MRAGSTPRPAPPRRSRIRNVVTIHDVGRAGGHAYVVSELVDGESLRSVLAAWRARASARARPWGSSWRAGWRPRMAAGVIHRDLKPENLLVARDGTLKILDFGLAKLSDGAGGLDATIPGTVLGTVGYMAPEQARGEPADARADLFAAGAVMYEMHTGRRAFDGASHAERLSAVLRDTPADASPIIARCLAKDPAARFQSAADLLFSLESEARPSTRRQPARSGRSEPSTDQHEDHHRWSRATPSDPERVERVVGESRGRGAGWISRRGMILAAGTGALGLLAGRALFRNRNQPPRPPTLRQLTFRQGRIMTARFARHGADIYYGAAWDGEPLATHALRLDGGVARTLALPAADVLAVSRTQLALALGRRNVDGQSATGRLALAPIDGGLPRELSTEVQEADFTPDGRELAIVVRSPDGFRLELPAGRVLLEGAGWITHPRVSPDGRRVACLLHPDAHDDQGSLVVVDRASGARRTLSDGWASVAGVAWGPRGDVVWMTGARTGADNALRAVSLDGTERVVFSTLGRLRLHDVADDGRVLISRDVWRLRTMVGGAGAPDVDRSLTPFSLVTDLSPDGSSLLLAELGDVDDVNGVYLVPTDGGPRLRLGPGWPMTRSPTAAASSPCSTNPSPAAPGPSSTASPAATAPRWRSLRSPPSAGPAGSTTPTSSSRAPPPTAPLACGAWPPTAPPLPRSPPRATTATAPSTPPAASPSSTPAPTSTSSPATPSASSPPASTITSSAAGTTATSWSAPPTPPSRSAASRWPPAPPPRYLTLDPPAVGLKGVDAVAVTATRHAYSYGQELSELFLLDPTG